MQVHNGTQSHKVYKVIDNVFTMLFFFAFFVLFFTMFIFVGYCNMEMVE